jgi:predicted ATPase/DNA-binding winged helix-turn-helix (wHTH) protein
VLEKDGRPLALGNRALDILIVLVEHRGEVVSHRELLSRAWRGLIVSPSNLRVHMNALRKALNDCAGETRYIVNVTGQGYCFVAPIQRRDDSVRAPAAPLSVSALGGKRELPPVLERMVGRDNEVRAVAADVIRERFVTVIGPGGIGKTTVAVAAAHTLVVEFAGMVCFVDLGAVSDPKRVVSAVASALGLTIETERALLMERLRGTRMLLVLDNCEHVVDAAASLAEHIFSEAPGVHLLATSREALRVEGEEAYLLAPLHSPSPGLNLTAEVARRYPAVQLFMERAAASGYRSNLTDAEAQIVAGICRKLDGITIAIELAASQVGTHGIAGTWNLLQRRLGLHWQGRRTAPSRHQTLWALLDWSYRLLANAEQLALRRLSAFIGAFTVDAAAELATIRMLDALVAKSLLSILTGNDGSVRYRVPEMTRTYILEKLHDGLFPSVGVTRGSGIGSLAGDANDARQRALPLSVVGTACSGAPDRESRI